MRTVEKLDELFAEPEQPLAEHPPVHFQYVFGPQVRAKSVVDNPILSFLLSTMIGFSLTVAALITLMVAW